MYCSCSLNVLQRLQIWTYVQQILAEKAWRVSLFCCSQFQNRDIFQAFPAEMFCKPASVRRPGKCPCSEAAEEVGPVSWWLLRQTQVYCSCKLNVLKHMQIWTCVQQILAENVWRVSLFCTSQSQNRETFQAFSAEMSCNSKSARRPVLKQLEKLTCVLVAILRQTQVYCSCKQMF